MWWALSTIATHCTHTHASDPLACLPTALGRTDHPLRVRWQDQQASGGVACGDVAVAGDAEYITTCHTRCPGASVPRTAGELSRAANIPRACLLTFPWRLRRDVSPPTVPATTDTAPTSHSHSRAAHAVPWLLTVEAAGQWCRRGLCGHFQVALHVREHESCPILVFAYLHHTSVRSYAPQKVAALRLRDTQIHIPRFGAVRTASCDRLAPPTRVRGTTRTGPLGGSDGRQSPSIAAPKAMPFAGASSCPVVASECIPVAQTTPRCENAVMNTHRRSLTRGTTTCRQVAGWGRMDRTGRNDGLSRGTA
jgi:hypothetical protein